MTGDEQFEQLIDCFKSVFGNSIGASDIPSASQEKIAAWDSIAQVTLLSLVGEKFGIDIDFEEFEQANSFASILDLIRGKMAHARS
jgi:acyl carrier protein